MTTTQDTPALAAAWSEARTRVFGGGFDASFRWVLLAAYVAGAIFFGLRGGGGAASLAAGFVAMALFLAMPLVMIFSYLFGLSFLAHHGGVPEDADPPLRTVIAALAGAIAVSSGFVAMAFALPVVGLQLRMVFS